MAASFVNSRVHESESSSHELTKINSRELPRLSRVKFLDKKKILKYNKIASVYNSIFDILFPNRGHIDFSKWVFHAELPGAPQFVHIHQCTTAVHLIKH